MGSEMCIRDSLSNLVPLEARLSNLVLLEACLSNYIYYKVSPAASAEQVCVGLSETALSPAPLDEIFPTPVHDVAWGLEMA